MSRNQKTVMIGGALILVALLLVCGPLTGRFGGPASVGEPPSVAAGPPAGAGVVGAGAAGAIVGAGVGKGQLAAAGRGAEGLADETERCRRLENETDEEWRRRLEQIENQGGFDEDCARWAAGSGYVGLAGAAAPDLAAAGVAGAGAAIAAGTASGLGSGSGASGSGTVLGATTTADLPLATPVSGLAADTTVLAANAFDTQLASVDAGPAGKVLNRFAPPVAGPGGGGYNIASDAQPFGVTKGNALQPCDQPGSGCRNIQGIPMNPPIIPGGRPTPPANPPIIPGGRPMPPVGVN